MLLVRKTVWVKISGVSVKKKGRVTNMEWDELQLRMFDEDKHAKYSLCSLGHQPFPTTATNITDLNGVIT